MYCTLTICSDFALILYAVTLYLLIFFRLIPSFLTHPVYRERAREKKEKKKEREKVIERERKRIFLVGMFKRKERKGMKEKR